MKSWSLFVLVLVLGGCATVALPSRTEIAAKMPLLVDLEEDAGAIKKAIAVFVANGALSEDQQRQAKDIYDLYFVHYAAATVEIARGERTFEENILRAAAELRRLAALLKGAGI